ncbi:formate dehydrogenase subunit delta [Aureimonas sp. SA4125]|uniref:formate dehydrogenase subunit delta n=1 Tax=Aureimonas sp. SA4125 TaxID=2826993 RepID=UPI001CC4796B|nr:formate dehydrogenase subunit delta [Aureimonas sp. SA4125]BDA83290.1 formate dehydrogenase subunit delta [Aureimonas sp. SA4125]
MQHDKLIHMANQIATFCASNPKGARATANVADHINSFWEPRMRAKLFERIESGSVEDVHPLVLEAMADIRRPVVPEATSQE